MVTHRLAATTLAFVFAVASLGSSTQNPVSTQQNSDAERIVGVWRAVKQLSNGQEELSKGLIVVSRMTFAKDGKATVRIGELEQKQTYAFGAPGQINVAGQPGIYRFQDDDNLTICTGPERPTDFTAIRGSFRTLVVLKRAKAGEEKPTAEELAKHKGEVDKLIENLARLVSSNNLKRIGFAIHAYHDTEKHIPLHAIYCKDGKTPLLSWRVAILPYLDQRALYKEFKLDEAWDSPHNKKLIARMPKCFEPVGAGKKQEGLTYYQAFSGPGTAFDGTKKIKLAEFPRGFSNTALAIEAREAVIWTQPQDLTLPKEKDKMPAVGGFFKSGYNVLMADATVRFLPHETTAADLYALVSYK